MAEENSDKSVETTPDEGLPDASGADAAEARPGRGEDSASPEELRARIGELERKVRDTHDRMLRAAADLENYRKRAAREREQYLARAGEDVIRDLLPALDNFDRALQIPADGTDVAAMRAGVEMIQKQLLDLLARRAVEPFDSVGRRFDPSVHEALQMTSSATHAPGTVISQFARGYLMGGKVLRPAIVIVADPSSSGGQAPDAPAASGDPASEPEPPKPGGNGSGD